MLNLLDVSVKLNLCRYHCWMQNEELRDLTASELLTLQEEFDMQSSWRQDEDSNI